MDGGLVIARRFSWIMGLRRKEVQGSVKFKILKVLEISEIRLQSSLTSRTNGLQKWYVVRGDLFIVILQRQFLSVWSHPMCSMRFSPRSCPFTIGSMPQSSEHPKNSYKFLVAFSWKNNVSDWKPLLRLCLWMMAIFPMKFPVACAWGYSERKLGGTIIKKLDYRLSTTCLIDSGPRTNCRSFNCYKELSEGLGVED